jgi:uncharacterized protein Yka (UPF0111/DUF47 family)
VLMAVRRSFVLPIAPEDVFELSERLDRVMNAGKDLVRESQLLGLPPDTPMAEMVRLVVGAVHQLVGAFPELSDGGAKAVEAADQAIGRVRDVGHVYRRAMSALLSVSDLREALGRQELYRRCTHLADMAEHVGTRLWYAVVKGD